MARIRSIKPEFPQSESIGRLSRDARLLFIQLWTLVDDDGRTRGSSRMLASLLYPYDDDAPQLIDSWLEELEGEDCIRRYRDDETQYLDIPNWLKHQRIDHKSASKLPPFRDEHMKPREPSRALAPDLDRIGLDRKEKENVGESEPKRSPLKYPPAFEGWWLAYPRTPIMSKKEALAAWNRLSPEDRLLAVSALPKYAAFLKSKPDHPVVHACRYLSQRRFEGFDAPASSEVKVSGFYAPFGSAELDAWDAHKRETSGGLGYARDPKGGWWFSSQWPPNHEERAA